MHICCVPQTKAICGTVEFVAPEIVNYDPISTATGTSIFLLKGQYHEIANYDPISTATGVDIVHEKQC